MRAIDADALMESSMYEFWQDNSAITPIGEYILSKFRNLIRTMPTIELERKKGKWIVKGEHPNYHLRCSECRNVAMWANNGISYIYPNFCPNCGSDMRGNHEE